jgi:hypothetical protein
VNAARPVAATKRNTAELVSVARCLMATAIYSQLLLFPTELVSVARCLTAILGPRGSSQAASHRDKLGGDSERLNELFVAHRQRATETSSGGEHKIIASGANFNHQQRRESDENRLAEAEMHALR